MQIIAHRGSQELMPENTLEAYKNAIKLGCTVLDADIVITKDNVVLVYHDLCLSAERCKNSSGKYISKRIPVRKLTFAQMQKYTVGECKNAHKYPELKQLPNVKIPSLESVLILLNEAENKHVSLNLEFKTSPLWPGLSTTHHEFAQAVIKLLKKHDFLQRVLFQSFDWNLLKYIHEHTTQGSILAISSTKSFNYDFNTLIALIQGQITDFWKLPKYLANMWGRPRWSDLFSLYTGCKMRLTKENGAEIICQEIRRIFGNRGVWSPDFHDLSKDNVLIAHRLGVKVYSWTLKNAEQTKDALAWQIDAAFHDRIDIGFELIKENASQK